MAEGVLLAKKDPDGAKKAIAKFLKVDDQKTLDAAYGDYAPYWETSLSVREQVIRAELGYLDPKEFPQGKRMQIRKSSSITRLYTTWNEPDFSAISVLTSKLAETFLE